MPAQVRDSMLQRHKTKYQFANIKGRAEQLAQAGQEVPAMDAQVRALHAVHALCAVLHFTSQVSDRPAKGG